MKNSRANWLAIVLFGALLFTAIVAARATVLNNSSKTMVRPALLRKLVGPNGNLQRALNQYKFDIGRYPERLDSLVVKPVIVSDAARWTGPYVTDRSGLKDPWDNDFQYVSPGKHNKDGVDIWSKGPDGIDGNEDDIQNWETDK